MKSQAINLLFTEDGLNTLQTEWCGPLHWVLNQTDMSRKLSHDEFLFFKSRNLSDFKSWKANIMLVWLEKFSGWASMLIS